MQTKKEYISRLIDGSVSDYLETFGAVCIEGPKWIGKTWTSSYHANSSFYLDDPADNFQNRELARVSPDLILEGSKPRLIDEWQEVPPIWDAVRHKVDEAGEKGQFILTGSATPNHKGIMHSGAGRIGRLRMHPMSLYESGASSGDVSLKEICANNAESVMSGEVNLGDLAELIVRGGWPGNLYTSVKRMHLLPQQYIEAVVEDDAYRIDGIKRNKDQMMRVLRSLARNETTTSSTSTIAKDVKLVDDVEVARSTIIDYLDVFDRLFLIDNQKPFSMNVRSSARLKKSEKRHLCDPSLACALLGLNPQMLINDLRTFGFLFEALCERDLKIYADAIGAQIYHYQDYANKEIDAVVQLSSGEWCAFEIKLGANQIDEAAANLLKIDSLIRGDENGKPPCALCVICGLTRAAYKRDDGVYVVPITSLKP